MVGCMPVLPVLHDGAEQTHGLRQDAGAWEGAEDVTSKPNGSCVRPADSNCISASLGQDAHASFYGVLSAECVARTHGSPRNTDERCPSLSPTPSFGTGA